MPTPPSAGAGLLLAAGVALLLWSWLTAAPAIPPTAALTLSTPLTGVIFTAAPTDRPRSRAPSGPTAAVRSVLLPRHRSVRSSSSSSQSSGPEAPGASPTSAPLTLPLVLAFLAGTALTALRRLVAPAPPPAEQPLPLSLAAVTSGPAPKNILIFGPNGSGKGTQGALIVQQFPGMAHIESGGIFREQIRAQTPLGLLAKEYIDRGDLVPDDVTVPMVLDTLRARGSSGGWLLDGFPRNVVQAEKLWEALQAAGVRLDVVVEILLPRDDARDRILGRRLCANDPNHPNNVGIPAIAPAGDACRVCGGSLSARGDDQDRGAVDKRHDIYYDADGGTLAAVGFYRRLADAGTLRFVQLDGTNSISAVKDALLQGLREG